MINFEQVKQDIHNLLLQHPDLTEDEDLRADTLEGATDIKEALALLLTRIEENTILLDGLEVRMSLLDFRKARFQRRVMAYRDVILQIMQISDLKKIELPTATLSQRKGNQRLLGEVDVGSLPDELVRIRREPNKTAIVEALQNGREIPGYALSNAEPALTIRIK